MGATHVDVVVVGAGISGIGAGYHLQTMSPDRSYVILEGRDDIGGTWDLFRYPGVRSDSDMHTLGYRFKPWTAAKAIADGPSILAYLRETVAEFGIDRHIRFGHRVRRAEWSSEDATWTVEASGPDGEPVTFTCNFLFMCSGYYSYTEPHDPQIPGIERFGGQLVHPQFWPEDLDYAGRRVDRHRLRGHGDDAGAGDGRRRRARDDAAALTDLRRVPSRRGRHRQRPAPRPPRQARLRPHPAQERRPAAVLLRAVPGPAGEGQGPAARARAQEPRSGLRRRHPLHAALQPVGPAAVPDPQR